MLSRVRTTVGSSFFPSANPKSAYQLRSERGTRSSRHLTNRLRHEVLDTGGVFGFRRLDVRGCAHPPVPQIHRLFEWGTDPFRTVRVTIDLALTSERSWG